MQGNVNDMTCNTKLFAALVVTALGLLVAFPGSVVAVTVGTEELLPASDPLLPDGDTSGGGLAFFPGDINGDGSVDLNDFGILKGNFGMASGAEWSNGDFNADGAVNLEDFNILKSNFGLDAPTPGGGSPMPEPLTMVGVAMAVACMGGYLRKRRVV